MKLGTPREDGPHSAQLAEEQREALRPKLRQQRKLSAPAQKVRRNEEEAEGAAIASAHAVSCKVAMVVHAQHAPTALAAVMRPYRTITHALAAKLAAPKLPVEWHGVSMTKVCESCGVSCLSVTKTSSVNCALVVP